MEVLGLGSQSKTGQYYSLEVKTNFTPQGQDIGMGSPVVGVGRPGICEGLGHHQAIRAPMWNYDSSELAPKEQAYAQDHLPKHHGALLQTEFRKTAPNPDASSLKSFICR